MKSVLQDNPPCEINFWKVKGSKDVHTYMMQIVNSSVPMRGQ